MAGQVSRNIFDTYFFILIAKILFLSLHGEGVQLPGITRVLVQFEAEFLIKFDFIHLYDGKPDNCICDQDPKMWDHICKNLIGCYNLTNPDFPTLFTDSSMKQNHLLVVLTPENVTGFYTVLREIKNFYTNSFPKSGILLNQDVYFILQWPTLVTSTSQKNYITEIRSTLQGIKLNLRSNLYVYFQLQTEVNNPNPQQINTSNESPEFSFWEFYQIKSTLISKEVDIRNLRFIIHSQLTRRENLYGEHIVPVAAEIGEYPFEITMRPAGPTENEETSKHYELESGLAVSIFNDFKFMLNFSSEYALGGDEIKVHPNSTMAGTSAAYFEAGLADILISHNTQRPSSASVVTFLQPTRLTAVHAYAKRPSLKMRCSVFLDTFTPRLWICLIGLCFVILISLNTVFWLRDHVFKFPQELQSQRTVLDTVSWIIGVVCQQGRRVFPSTISVQIITITTHLAMVILYCAYSAKLVSNLSVQVPEIQSFDDFLFHKFQLIIDDASVSMVKYGEHLKLYYGERLHSEVQVVESRELMRTLMESKSALLSYDDDMYRYYGWHSEHPDRFVCSSILRYSAEEGFPTRVGMVLPKSSTFKELFNYKIMMLMERGLNSRYNKIYHKQTQPQCLSRSLVQLLEPTGLNEVVSATFVLAFGFVSSALSLIFERILARKIIFPFAF